MSNKKTAFVQWILMENGTPSFYYTPIGGEGPGSLWSNMGIAFQLWTDDGPHRVLMSIGSKDGSNGLTYAVGTSAQLAAWGFDEERPLGYGTDAAFATLDTQILRMALTGSPANPTSAGYTHDEVGMSYLHHLNLPDGGFTGIAVPTLHTIDVHGAMDIDGNFQSVVIADNGISPVGQRTGDLTMYAGGGAIVVRFHGEVSLARDGQNQPEFWIQNKETGEPGLGVGRTFQVLDQVVATSPGDATTLVLSDAGLDLGSSTNAETFEYGMTVNCGGSSHTVDPKIINRSTTMDN